MAANNLDCRNGGTDGSDVTQEPSGYEPDELPLLHPAMGEQENLTTHTRHIKRREYMRAYQRNWLAARRRRYLSYKRCGRCGKTETLEIHHVDPEQKVSHRIWSWSDERRNTELAKCEILCRSCHNAHHKSEMEKPIVHGTITAYKTKGCRCAACKNAHKFDAKAYRERKQAFRLRGQVSG